MTMDGPLAEVCCVSLPAASLAWLAPLRVHAGIRVFVSGDRAWLWWEAGDEVVLQHVLALDDVELFARREDRWYRPGRHLPAFEVPPDVAAQPLLHVLTPSPVQAAPHARSLRPIRLTLVREDRPRVTSALLCTLAELGRWAEQATSKQLALLTAIHSGPRVLLRGERLPSLPDTERYWGRTILTPLGFRPEPAMSEGVLREALGLRDEEIALLGEDGFEAIDARRFQPLTRAGVRLALKEVR
jgi:hypothetical protein